MLDLCGLKERLSQVLIVYIILEPVALGLLRPQIYSYRENLMRAPRAMLVSSKDYIKIRANGKSVVDFDVFISDIIVLHRKSIHIQSLFHLIFYKELLVKNKVYAWSSLYCHYLL